MGPAFLRLAEALIDRRIITYQNAVERRFIQDLLKRLTVFVDALEHHGERLGQKRPDAVDAPARFVAVHDGRIGQQHAERIKLLLPSTGELVEQRIGL